MSSPSTPGAVTTWSTARHCRVLRWLGLDLSLQGGLRLLQDHLLCACDAPCTPSAMFSSKLSGDALSSQG